MSTCPSEYQSIKICPQTAAKKETAATEVCTGYSENEQSDFLRVFMAVSQIMNGCLAIEQSIKICPQTAAGREMAQVAQGYARPRVRMSGQISLISS